MNSPVLELTKSPNRGTTRCSGSGDLFQPPLAARRWCGSPNRVAAKENPMFTRHLRSRGTSADGPLDELRREERHRAPRNAAGYLRCTWRLTEQGHLVASWHRVLPSARHPTLTRATVTPAVEQPQTNDRQPAEWRCATTPIAPQSSDVKTTARSGQSKTRFAAALVGLAVAYFGAAGAETYFLSWLQ
jgi:hypothetical protein